MKKKNVSVSEFDKDLREIKTAGFKANKREKNVNRRAGLHDKKNKQEGETRVKRRKPLALKHVRRMRKAALALSCVFVLSIAAVGVGFFTKSPVEDLPEVDYATVCYETPTDGSNPTAHTLVENVGYMNYVLKNQPHWSSEMQSTVFTVMQQRVYTYKQFYNGVLISADIAQGVSSEATQFCVTDEVVLWRSAANKNFDGMNTPWSTKDAQGLTISQFKQKRGLPPSEFSVYILNEKTIKNAQDYTVTANADGTYSMTIELNVNTGDGETSADYFYKQQMLVTGGLDEHPAIDATRVSYVFDKDWQVLSFKITDSYSAKMGISVHCTSETNVNFSYKEEDAVNSFYEDYFKKYEQNFTQAEEPDSSEPNALNYLAAAFGNVLSEGATFKLDLNAGALNLDGAVHVGLSDGALSDVRAELGDISIFVDENLTLYVNDGKAKYKLCLGGMLASQTDGETAGVAGLDVNAILDQLTAGVFSVEGDITTLNSNLEIFGLSIDLKFEFNTANGVELNFVAADIPFNDTVIKARLEYGTEQDIPELPADLASYTDILNEGVSLDIALTADGLKLDGVAQIVMENGAFGGVRAELGNFGVYYDCPRNMLYLTDGNFKFKLSLAAVSGGDLDLNGLLGSLDKDSLLSQIISNIATGDGYLSTNATIDVLEQTITAALGVRLSGGIEVSANFRLFGKQFGLTAGLTNDKIELPDFSGYTDILNDGLTIDLSLKIDEVTLDGAVYIGLSDGKLNEIRADFGDLKVYYFANSNELYFNVDEIKAMLALDKMEDASALDVPALFSGEISDIVCELLGNFAASLKEVSTSANIHVLDSVIPAKLTLDFAEGVNVSAEVSLLGINLSLNAAINTDNTAVPELNGKDGYVDVLADGWQLADALLGEKLTATVSGNVYRPDDGEYSESGYHQYYFNASIEYDKGYTLNAEGEKVANGFPVHFDAGVEKEDGTREGMNFYLDSTLYVHFNLSLIAKSKNDESLYLDAYLMDATPEVTSQGKTGGAYYADGVLDVYLLVSKFAPGTQGYDPLMIYAPVDEIMTLVSMAASAANLDKLEFKDSEALTKMAGEISNVVNQLLIEKYIPKTKDQFASLGESLIPQIFNGKNLSELLNGLLGDTLEKTEEIKESGFRLDEEYIKGVSYGEDGLNLTLNSSLVYGKEIAEADNMVIEINRGKVNGVNYLTNARVNNIFFGENNGQKMNIALALDYGDVQKPETLKGYLSLSGIDGLLKAAVNSATHETQEGQTDYELNNYYLLNGSLKIKIEVFGATVKADLPITVNSLAVFIDKSSDENVADKVHADLHISYPGQKAKVIGFIPVTIINGTTDVYMSIKEDMIYIKRVQTTDENNKPITPVTEMRVMPLNDFLADIMNQLSFVLNMAPILSDNLGNINTSESSGNGFSFDGKDLGAAVNSILSYYTYTETDTTATWNIGINGQILKDLAGMTADDIPVSFRAVKNADKTLTISGLDIANTDITVPLIGKSGVKISLSGNFNYCNPHQKIVTDPQGNEIYSDTTIDLITAQGGLEELSGYNWSQVLGGQSYEEILNNINWKLLLADTGKNHLSFGNGSDLAVATLRYERSTDVENNGSFEEFGTRQLVLYNASNNNIYTNLKKPSLGVMNAPAGKTAVWSDSLLNDNGTLVKRAVYDVTYTVKIDSKYETDGFVYEDGVWRKTVEEAYGYVYLNKDVLLDDGGVIYGIKGYSVTPDGELLQFGGLALNEKGEPCYAAEVTQDITYYVVWERVYAVNFVTKYINSDGEDVSLTQTVYYFAGESVADRAPAVPDRVGYTGEWDIDLNTVIEAGKTYTVNATYNIDSYNVNIISDVEVEGGAFVYDAENGKYVNSAQYEYGASGILPESLTSVSPAFAFGGIYDNPSFAGEPVKNYTVLDGDLNYYVKWIGKTVTVTFKSDLPFTEAVGNVQDGDGNYYFKNALTYGESNAFAGFDIEGRALLGWFMQAGDNYAYYATAEDLLNAYESAFAQTSESNIDVVLWAVWTNGISFENVALKKAMLQWRISGSYSVNFVGEKSAEIAAKANLTYNSEYYFYLSFDGGNSVSDTLNSKKVIGNGTNMSFDSGNKNSASALGQKNVKGSVELTSTITCNGVTVATLTGVSAWV